MAAVEEDRLTETASAYVYRHVYFINVTANYSARLTFRKRALLLLGL